MMSILLLIHIIIAVLLITVILLQKSGSDGLSGIGGGNMGLVSGRTAAGFLTNTTIILAGIFMINSILLANLSIEKNSSPIQQNESHKITIEQDSLPIAE